MKIVFALICFLSMPLEAADETFDNLFERKSISCEQDGVKWSLSLRARTEKPDPQIDEKNLGQSHLFLVGKSKHLIASIPPLPHSPYTDGQFSFTNHAGICHGTSSNLLNPSVVAIIFQQTPIVGPGIPHLVFYDFQNDRIIDKVVSLGRANILDPFLGNGFLYTPVVNRSEAASGLPVVLRKKKFVWSDHDLHAVKSVTLNKGKIENRFDQDLSWKLSPWGRFFKNKELFLKAAAWNSLKKEFTNNFVFHASAIDEECILLVPYQSFSSGADLSKQKGWLCQKMAPAI